MKSLSAILMLIAMAVFLSFLLSYPVMLLWNGCLVPAISVLNKVTWLQTWGICILFNFLVKTNVSTSSK